MFSKILFPLQPNKLIDKTTKSILHIKANLSRPYFFERFFGKSANKISHKNLTRDHGFRN